MTNANVATFCRRFNLARSAKLLTGLYILPSIIFFLFIFFYYEQSYLSIY